MKQHVFFKIIVPAIFICIPFSIHAAEVTLYPSQTPVRTGEYFSVDVLVHSDENLNAAEGVVAYPADMLVLQEVRDGNSVIDFWAKKESATSGVVSFSGITPGGFEGANQKILSLYFEAITTGTAAITVTDVALLRADGEGTPANIEARPLLLTVVEGDGLPIVIATHDVEQPEDFTPMIVSDDTLFDGQWYLVFATQDKGVGMSHFEVKEGVFSFYKKAASPYVIKDQGLTKDIFVKAVDFNGNERIAVVVAHHEPEWSLLRNILGGVILLMAVLLIVRKKWLR